MYNREFIDNNLNMFNWWYIEKFNLSRLKRVYIIFYYISHCIHLQLYQNWTQKEEFSFLCLFFFFNSLSNNKTLVFSWFFKKIVGIGCITFSYQQHKTQNFLIISPVWERGKMILCNDWANHQNISQNWQGWSGGRESLKFESENLEVFWGVLSKICLTKECFLCVCPCVFFLESTHIAFWF